MRIDLIELLHQAYNAGFAISGEGWNADYPFYGDAEHAAKEIADLRTADIESLLAAVKLEDAECS